VSEGSIDEAGLRKLRHDLSSPLMIISGFAQLLNSDRDFPAEERREYAQRIEDAARQVRDTIDETIDLVRGGGDNLVG
jgi:signal transduction histidine kinase